MLEILGIIATILGVITGIGYLIEKAFSYYLKRQNENKKQIINILNVDNVPKMQEAKRDVFDISNLKFIESLPEERALAYKNAHKKWDTGVTSLMREGNYDVIEFLKVEWLKLSEFYTSHNFEGKTSEEYINDYIKKRFSFHWAKHMPNGKFQSGTIVYVMVGADVITDMEILIDEIVGTLSFYNENFNYLAWQEKWKVIDPS